MRQFQHRSYYHPMGCGPLALRQLCDAPDHAVMSAMILHGYDAERGGTSPETMYRAANQLGIKLGDMLSPSEPLPVFKLGDELPRGTYIVAVPEHVFVLRDGEVLDRTGLKHELIEFVWKVN